MHIMRICYVNLTIIFLKKVLNAPKPELYKT